VVVPVVPVVPVAVLPGAACPSVVVRLGAGMPRPVTPGDCVALSEFIPVAPVPVGLLWVPGAVVTPLPPGPPLPPAPPAPWASAAAMGVNAKAEANAKAYALLIIFFASLSPAEIAGTWARTSGGGFGSDQTSGGRTRQPLGAMKVYRAQSPLIRTPVGNHFFNGLLELAIPNDASALGVCGFQSNWDPNHNVNPKRASARISISRICPSKVARV
jgi:hypothetical protein